MMHGTIRYSVNAGVVEFRVGDGETWEKMFCVLTGCLPIVLLLADISGMV
jgi:hypothetical protein